MSQQKFRNVNNVPMHGNAGSCSCGNARENFQYMAGGYGGSAGAGYGGAGGAGRGGAAMKAHPAAAYGMKGRGYDMHPSGMAGGTMAAHSCHFPRPAPKRCYCMAAPFSTLGPDYQRLTDAYGHSTACGGY